MDGLLFDLRRTLNDINKGVPTWRRVGRQVVPVAAAAAVATAALFAQKQRVAPDTALLQRRARFTCSPASELAARGALPAPAAVEKALRGAGASAAEVAALRRAAQRLRGPIERDLLVAESQCSSDVQGKRQELYRELVQRWRQAGYLSEPEDYTKPRDALGGVDYVTQTDESYGRDVGCLVPPLLLRSAADPDAASLSVSGTQDAVGSLEDHGVIYLKGLLRGAEIQALRDRLQLQISALDRARTPPGSFPPVREYDASLLQAEEPDLEPVQSTGGRRHFYLRGRTLEQVVSGVQAGTMPLVWSYLERAAEAAGLPPGSRPYVSEVQLLVTDPCAVDQFWHVDNTSPGLTVFVPITDVPEDIGPTLFLPGSHRILAEVSGQRGVWPRLKSFASSFFSCEGVVVGSMGAGDALIYDSRLVHRGAANRKYDRTRVALVFRYDFVRPPGVGAVGTQLVSWTGNVLSVVQRIYAALPGPAPAAAAAVDSGATAAAR